ncbi:hypothetical protein D3C72_2403650 [compost metagenome]
MEENRACQRPHLVLEEFMYEGNDEGASGPNRGSAAELMEKRSNAGIAVPSGAAAEA